MRRMILTGSLLLALSATAMASQVYKWVDTQGITHFGAQPPQGQDATAVNTVTAPPKPPAPAAAPAPDSTTDAAQKAIDDKVKKDVATQELERKKYCETVRTNLAQLQNNPRLRAEVDGETHRLTEEERQGRITESEKAIAENCK
ncbi:DUF4124 domain-containing protein [Pseudomonas sp. 2FE]|uniref:DUF4124 domain-containing protein n=1 Tax=Pseudomonas sp. 2FE TaxID=2502190 RepID=UPI0010F6EA3E|nr:DUF4124 domain-containing protein [Pseudomonas sp. 2FE]